MARHPRRILFQGLGGAGQRHLRIFRALLPDARMFAWRRTKKTPVLNPDFTVDAQASLEARYGIEVLPTLEEGYARSPDLTVICTPSALQAQAVADAARRGVDVFVEKPGAINAAEASAIESAARAGGADVFVSFQRRFHPLVQRVRALLESRALGEIMSVRVDVASHVPDWHPYEDFRALYACRADLGGGVLRTECHELDLVAWFFGMPRHVSAVLGCRGPHRLDVEDSADLLLDYGTFAARVSLCMMQRRQERRIAVRGSAGWLDCDLIAQRLEFGLHGTDAETVSAPVDADALFRLQAACFLDGFERGSTEYLEAMRNVTTIVDAAESAARSLRASA